MTIQLSDHNETFTFIPAALCFASGQRINVFADLKSPRTLRETLTRPAYARFAPQFSDLPPHLLDQPLGTALKQLKDTHDHRYALLLNRYGDSIFCAFTLCDPTAQKQRGLYCFTLHKTPMYIGRCNDSFQKRIDQGYGRISPKNCYVDGQATNCHLNALIANHPQEAIGLYVCALVDKRKIDESEQALIAVYQPEWNIMGRK